MTTAAKVFKAVPFNPKWIDHEKIDIHAIYRRPVLDHRGRQKFVDGIAQWDYTGGLPVRRHHDYAKKGFEYVTLASGADMTKEVVAALRADGHNPRDFIMDDINMSPWDPELYLATIGQVEAEKADALTTMVEQFGSDAVLMIKRSDNPRYTLPEHLMGIPPGGKVKRDAGDATQATPKTAAAPKAPAPRRNNAAGRETKKHQRQAAAAQGPSSGGAE